MQNELSTASEPQHRRLCLAGLRQMFTAERGCGERRRSPQTGIPAALPACRASAIGDTRRVATDARFRDLMIHLRSRPAASQLADYCARGGQLSLALAACYGGNPQAALIPPTGVVLQNSFRPNPFDEFTLSRLASQSLPRSGSAGSGSCAAGHDAFYDLIVDIGSARVLNSPVTLIPGRTSSAS